MSNIRSARRFRELAGLLRDEAVRRGVMLVAGEAEEILAERLSAVATQLRITERTTLDRYLTEESVVGLAQTLGAHAATYREAAEEAEPVTIAITDAGRVVAALGMTVKLAAEHVEKAQADALGVAHDGADALVGIGVAIRAADGAGQVQIGGRALVWTRSVLVRTIEPIGDGQWECPCRTPHETGVVCYLRRNLTSDLKLVGGWLVEEGEGPGHKR